LTFVAVSKGEEGVHRSGKTDLKKMKLP
jgi:hypothetical protein